MKSILLHILLIIIVIIDCKAQTVFLPNKGTTWHYLFDKVTGIPTPHNCKIVYERDSLLNGDTVKVLSTTKNASFCNLINQELVLIKQVNDSILFKNVRTNNTWQLLYNFGKAVGQSWNFTVSGPLNFQMNYTVTVNAVNTITVNSVPLKSLNVTYSFSVNQGLTIYHTDIINERFGDMKFLFNMRNFAPFMSCDNDIAIGILCYQDSTFGLKQFTNFVCDYPNTVLNIKENKQDDTFKLYPNPVISNLTVEVNTPVLDNYELQLVNYLGEVILQTTLQQPKTELDVSYLPKGIYFVKLFKNGEQKVFKVVKE